MELEFNIFSITLLVSGTLTAAISIIILKKLTETVRWFGLIMLLIAVWAIAYGFELSSGNFSFMKTMVIVQYLGISFLPALWIVFIVKFVGKEKWLTKRNLQLIFSFPVITFLMVLTNDFHHLHYKTQTLDTSGPFPLLSITAGIWYKIHTAYFYLLLGAGIYLLISQFKKADPVFKRQNSVILLGAIVPWIINFIYLLDYRPFKHIDLTPFAFILTSLIISLGLLRFRLFDIIPVAREKVIENMREGVLVLDPEHRIVDANSEMKKILAGYQSNLIGRSLKDVFNEETSLMLSVERRLEKEAEVEISDHSYEVNVTSLFEKHTIYSGTVLLFRDITERKAVLSQLEKQSEELLALNKLKDKLFSVVAHDLRSPIVNLVEILNFTEDGIVTEEEFKSFLPSLKQNVNYTSQLLENLLSWSKSQLRGEDANPEEFDIGDPEINRIHQFRNRAKQKGINLLDDLKPGTMIYADVKMVQLVIRNLITNAKKFCTEGDLIRVFAEQSKDHTTIHVLDTGPGISEADGEKLFKMDGFTTRGTKDEAGTGLGLLICKEFIEKNNGTIGVHSFLGQGSDFYFTLPNRKS